MPPDHARSRPVRASLVALLLLVTVATTMAAATSSARAISPGSPGAAPVADRETSIAATRTAFIDFDDEPQIEPTEIAFTANCGPHIRDVSWNYWGSKEQAVGRGQYVGGCSDDCAKVRCAPGRVELFGRAYCPSLDVFHYRYGYLFRRPTGRQSNVQTIYPSPCPRRGSTAADTFTFSIGGGISIKPKKIFFAANCGSYTRRLEWSGWGSKRAVARGQYVQSCSSDCAQVRCTPARIVFGQRTYCATLDASYYRRGLLYRKPTSGQDNPAEIFSGFCPSRRDF